MASFSRSSFIPQSVVLNPQCRNNPVVLQIKSINNDMRKIDAYVVLGLQGHRKVIDEQRKEDLQNKRRAKQAERFQKTKGNPINFIKEDIPKTGFLDTIKNFILYTFMGMASQMVIKNLPAILNTIKMLVPVADFLDKFFSNVLGGVVNAIDFGYKVHDKIRGVLKNITGSKFEKQFDELEKTLNTFLNIAIISGLAVAGSGGFGGGSVPRGGKPVGGSSGIGGYPSRNSQVKYIEKKYGYEASKVYENSINQGGSKAKALADVRGKFNPLEFQGGLKGGVGPGKVFSRGIGRAPSRLVTKLLGKTGKRLLLGRIPIIGGLIDFTLSVLMGENPGRAAARAVGSTAGAALGTLIPVPFAGTILGSILGDIVGGALYDTLTTFGKPKGHAKGGQIGAKSYSRTPRTVKKSKAKRPPKQNPVPSRPGKSIGGREEIVKIFPESEDPNVMSPLTMLTKNSAVMKRAGVFGSLMGAGLDMMALGQKVERSTIKGLERYLGFVIQSAIDNQSQENARSIGASMYAMATGGVVPATRTLGGSGLTTGEMVAKEMMRSFTAMLDSRSTEIFQNIRKQLELKPKETPEEPPSGETPDGSFFNGDYTDLLNLISKYESANGGYNAYNEGGAGGGYKILGYSGPSARGPIRKNLTDMTIAEIMQHQANKNPPIHAAGRYQIIGPTMKGLINGAYGNTGVKATDKFTPENQDKLAIALIRARLSTGATNANFISEWRGLINARSQQLSGAIQRAKGGNIGTRNMGSSISGLNVNDPIGLGKQLISMGFNVGENKYFINNAAFGSKFVPLGNAPMKSHEGIAHDEYALDVTDWKGGKSEGIQRLKILFRQLYSQRTQLGITELIFDPAGHWFDGMNSYSSKPWGGHHDHLHIRFKKSASSMVSRYLPKPQTKPIQNKKTPLDGGSTSSIFVPSGNSATQLAQATNKLNRGPYSDSTNTVVMLQTVLT